MNTLTVLLIKDPAELVEESIRLQRELAKIGTLRINFQNGGFAQFIVETRHCVMHLKRALQKLGFNVEVSTDELPLHIPQGGCHECQTTQ